MKQQHLGNHRRWVIMYHLITFLAILALIVGSIRYLMNTSEDNLYLASLIVLISFIVLFLFFFSRSFALRAQDRVIVFEERFRYYKLTGEELSSALTIRQIIGLRFASDEEFPELAKRAEKENLSENAIKKNIKEWRGDHYRV